ncbi:MAG: protein kinase [Proteobacteria bacterium]|nr:protein kinase [Pseudomonadota bacterium]
MSDKEPRVTESTEELRKGFDAAKPAAPPVEREKLLAQLRETLFGVSSEPVKRDRFVLLEQLGAGGMGVVYAAYDPRLDRRVALKLIAPGKRDPQETRERFLREAQALARLAHPNVVPIHDVGILSGNVFIVMEFVQGQTLDKWVKARERPWRDVLAVYLQAGRGLAAAHAQALIHRDFKPKNAIIGNDQRVRVIDFGLARGQTAEPSNCTDENTDVDDAEVANATTLHIASQADSGEDPSAMHLAASVEAAGVKAASVEVASVEVASGGAAGSQDPSVAIYGASDSVEAPDSDRLQTPLTRTGVLIGTPHYMAPEQFTGANVGPKADQFSFCVALYQALYRERPYPGDSRQEIVAAMHEHRLVEPRRGHGVPRWIYPVLRRGLELEPDRRYPSMNALLTALERDPARARRRWITAIAAVAAIGIAVNSLSHQPAAAVCKGAEYQLAGVWNGDRRASLEQAFAATGQPYAEHAWPRVAAGLDAYARDWADMSRDACIAHRRGLQSGVLFDKRMSCLDRRKTSLASALSVLAETDAESLTNAVQVVQSLPSLGYCADTEALTAEVAPPEDAATAGRVDALRKQLSRARALEHTGRYSDGLTIADAVVSAAESVGYKPLLAEALLVQGRINLFMNRRIESIEPLHRAATVGLAAGTDAIALQALARRVYSEGTTEKVEPDSGDRKLVRVLSWAQALAERAPRSAFGHALLLNNAGVVYMVRGDADRAREYFEKALNIKNRATDVQSVELANILSNLALVTPGLERRVDLSKRVLEQFERALGPTHPQTLARHLVYGHTVMSPRRAHEILEPACLMYERYHRKSYQRLARCMHYLGFLDAELGERERAASRLTHLYELLPARDDLPQNTLPEYNAHRELARGYALLYRGEYRAALAPFQASIDALEDRKHHWWIEKRIAAALLGQGMSELARGNLAVARQVLDRARSVFVRMVERGPNVDQQRRLALAQVALARALWSDGSTGEDATDRSARAEALISRAETWYRSAGPGYEWRLRELKFWRQQRGLRER